MSPDCDLEHSKPIFFHDTLAHDGASPYTEFDYKKFSSCRDIIHMNSLNLSCDLDPDHNRAIQSFQKTIQLKMMCNHTKFRCNRIRSSENTLESHILITGVFTVTLTLKKANQSFWQTHWFMMMHYHTIFGNKRFSSSKNIVQKNIHWHFAVTITLNTAQFLSKTLWFMIMHYQTVFDSKRISSSEDIVQTVVFWSHKPLLWPWPSK